MSDAGEGFCEGYSFVLQYALVGSELWFGAMSLNLWVSTRNPFTQPSANNGRFFVVVNAISVIGAAALVGSHSYGRSVFRVCYIPQRLDLVAMQRSDIPLWLLFNLPILAVWVFSFVVAVQSYVRLKRGLRETFKARERAMRRARDFIICYSVYWLLVGVLYVAALKRESTSTGLQLHDGNVPGAIFTFLFTSKSAVTLVVRRHVSRVVSHSHGHAACGPRRVVRVCSFSEVWVRGQRLSSPVPHFLV